jgi:hypothetical protein
MPAAWEHRFPQFGKETYLTSIFALPKPIRPATLALEAPIVAEHCWSEPWGRRRFGD